MDRDNDLEKSLTSFNAGPGEKVRRAVMDAYGAEFAAAGGNNFWRRAVPMYKAVAAAILIALFSALTGAYFAGSSESPRMVPAVASNSDSVELAKIKPVIAENDAF